MDFKKYTQLITIVLIILPFIIVVLGLLNWSENVYTGIIYVVVGALQFLSAIFVYPRIAKVADAQMVGNRVVQQNWLILSLGIAGMALFSAPFFKIEPASIPYITFIISTVLVILSGFNILMAVRKVKARMVA